MERDGLLWYTAVIVRGTMRKPQKRVYRLSLCRPEPCIGGSGGIHEDRRLYSMGNLKQILTGFVFNSQTVWILSDGWVLIDTCGSEFDCGTVGPSSIGSIEIESQMYWSE